MIDKKHYRPLGSTGIKVSPLGLGTVKFGRNTNVKYKHGFSIPDDKVLKELLELALSSGINLIDTAPAYGNSESRVGGLIHANRDDWCLCTKVGESYQQGSSTYDFSAKATRLSVESSLRNLDTDVLDLVLIHSDGDDENIIQHSDVIETLQELKTAGYIRSIGMSTKTVSGGLLALEELDVLMVALNEEDQSQVKVIETAAQKNKGILIKKALASGHALDANKAINYAVNFPGVSSIIVGTINPVHLMHNIAALNL